MKYCGIYSISFLGDKDKYYIGSSNDICRRGAEHLNFLRQNKHCNKKLQNSFNKYGLESFVFEIIETITFTTYEELRKLEQNYLDTFFKASTDKEYFKNKSYNLSITTNMSCGSIENNYKVRKISVFDLNMNFIEEINGVRETERVYNLQGIHKCCKGKRGRVGNYIFRYSDDLDVEFKTKKGKGFRKCEKRKHVKPIAQYDFISKEFIKNWRCAEDASKELGLYNGGISRVLSGEYSDIKGYYFKYI